MKSSLYLSFSVILLLLVTACTQESPPNIDHNSFAEMQFDIRRKQCEGKKACLLAIDTLRQCYINNDALVLEGLTETKELHRAVRAQGQCQKDLGFTTPHKAK